MKTKKKKSLYTEQELFQERLREQLEKHRKKLKFTQSKVAELLDISEKTYQRWESEGVGSIDRILELFQILEFSDMEIMDLFGVSPVTLSNSKDVPANGTLKNIRESNICTYIDNNCIDMEDATIERLLGILFYERMKRH